MLEGLGGFQVRYFKLIPAGSSNKVPKETDEIRKGFEHIRKFGPQGKRERRVHFLALSRIGL